MSDSDRKRNERRQRRRRVQSAHTVRSDDTSDTHRYTRLLEKRLQNAELLPKEGRPIVAMQVRHINNRQHAIPFRQQFIEQIVQDFQYIDRQLEADRRKQAEKNDKENARLRRQLERVHQKKVRELELYNHRGLVRELLEEQLKNSTSEVQLPRISQLEEDFRKLKQKHIALVQRVHQNKHKYDNQMNKRFEEYQIEIDEYKREMTKKIADLEAKLEKLNKNQELLNEKQEEHGISIKDLSLQPESLQKLAQQIEQVINARRLDLDKLDKFNGKLITFESTYQELKDRIDDIKNNDLWRIQQQFQSINNDLEIKASQIIKQNTFAKQAVDQINELRQFLASIGDKLSDLANLIRDIENIKTRLDSSETKFDEQQRIRAYLEDLANKQRQLIDLANDLDNLKRLMNDLSKPVIINNEPIQPNTNDRGQEDLQNFFQQVKREIMEPVLNFMQHLNGQINEAKTLINRLETQLNQLLNAQPQSETPTIIQPNISSKVKLIPFVESLPPIDLLQDIWK